MDGECRTGRLGCEPRDHLGVERFETFGQVVDSMSET